MGILEKTYWIDPGSYSLKILDPKDKTIHSIRSVCLQKQPEICGQDAFDAYLKDSRCRLLYPLDPEVHHKSAVSLFSKLMEEIPASRFLVKPKAVLFKDSGMPLDESLWKEAALKAGFSSLKIVDPLTPSDKSTYLQVHAGEHRTILQLCSNKKVLVRRDLDLAGITIDRAIAHWVAQNFNAMLFLEDARALRTAASDNFYQKKNPMLQVCVVDRHMEYTTASMKASSLWELMRKVEIEIAKAAAGLVCACGPDVMEQALKNPVRLSGGLANCCGLKEILQSQLSDVVYVPEQPETVFFRSAFSKKNLKSAAAEA